MTGLTPIATRSAALTLCLLVAIACDGRGVRSPREPAAGPPVQQPPGPWFVVDEAALALVDEERVGKVGFPGRLQLLQRADLEPPVDHPIRRSGGVVIVHTEIAPNGRIARARLVRASPFQTLEPALVSCLRQWEFEPIRYRDEPWSVRYTISLAVHPPTRTPGSIEGQANG